MQRRDFLQASAAALALTQQPWSYAQSDYPSRPVKIVVPYNAGGSTDAMARMVAEFLSKDLGQPFMVENKAGASGILGTDQVAKSKPDGYQLVFSISTSLMTNQFIYAKLPYDPVRDLTMLSLVSLTPVVFLTRASAPARNFAQLLDWIRSNRGKLSYGSWGTGSYAHLAGEHMSRVLDADMQHIIYKGEAPMVQALVADQLDIGFATASTAKGFIEAGKVKAFGVNGKQRLKSLPNVPTVVEQGQTDSIYATVGYTGIAVPKATPIDIQNRLSQALARAGKDPKIIQFAENAGMLAAFSDQATFQKLYDEDMVIWKHLVQQAKIEPI